MLSVLVALAIGQLSGPVMVNHPPITEMSGIVKSTQFSDTYWVHNDSGDSARIFAINSKGAVITPPDTSRATWAGMNVATATNVDWEDIAIDGPTLYIADVGNNANNRQNLGIYVVTEPNPRSSARVRANKHYRVRYPDQTSFPASPMHFDCEAVFFHHGKLFLITKHRAGQLGLPDDSAKLYRLDTLSTAEVNVLTKLDEIDNLGGWVTAADVSPDGTKLAVLCQAVGQSVWIFDATRSDDKFFSGTSRKIPLSGLQQAEAICFDGNETVVITNEQRQMWRLGL